MTRLLGPPLIKARRQIPATGTLGVLIEYGCRVDEYDLIEGAIQRFAIEVFHDQALIKTNAIANLHSGCRGSNPETFFRVGELYIRIAGGVERRKDLSFIIWKASRCACACLFGKCMNGA